MHKENLQPLESSRHTQCLCLSHRKGRGTVPNEICSPFAVPAACWSLCCLWSPRGQVNSRTEPSSQTLCCLPLLLWWIQSTAQTRSASVKDKAGDLQCFLHTSGSLQTQTAQHTALSSCVLYSLSLVTQDPMHLWGRRNLCSMAKNRENKNRRTKPASSLNYILDGSCYAETLRNYWAKKCLPYKTAGQSTLWNPKI